MLKGKNIYKSFDNIEVLKDINIEIERGKIVSIVGKSGAGKSTLLYILSTLDKATNGEVLFDNKKLDELKGDDLSNFRNKKIGFIFQFHFLLPSITNIKNILLPCEIGGGDMTRVKKMTQELAEYLDVAHCLKKFPYQLSGGEQQRINIIRALSMRPQLLLCDEPTGNLDSENSSKVTELLKKLAKEFGATLIVVTHDRAIANSFNNKFVMKDGRLLS